MARMRRQTRARATRRSFFSAGRARLGLLVLLAAGLPLVGGLFAAAERPSASQAASPLRIISPTDGAVIGDGNLVLVEGTAVDRIDGVVDAIEVGVDNDASWAAAERAPDDPTRWRYLWVDPSPGLHRIRARAFGLENQDVVEQSVGIRVENAWSTRFMIDNPYIGAGTHRKGQLHVHSTHSFDGWTSLPPAELALEYKRRGYQFVVITDHDVIAHPWEVNDPTFIAIPGYESTSGSGHITALFVQQVVSPALPPQRRIDEIVAAGGMAILNHPGWRVGWTGTDFRALQRYVGFEIFNGVTSNLQERARRNTQLWHEALNAKGWAARIWAVAVDDAHDPDAIDRGWVMVKTAELTEGSIQQALERGAFYASNGPSLKILGVLGGAITAASPDATTIRFIDQEMRIVAEGPGSWASYRPTGAERWVRVEALAADGRTAWSQPFWLTPNAPKVAFVPTWEGMALVGETIPGARVHVSDRGEYLGHVVADSRGQFVFSSRSLDEGPHEFWVMATAPWPDELNGPPTLLSYQPSAVSNQQSAIAFRGR